MVAERNIEGYRLMADVLLAMRSRLDTEMRALFGQLWLGERAPEPVRRRLAERKDLENSVAWYVEGERELFEYADFVDISEVLQTAGSGPLEGVFPKQELLQARLIELGVVQSKLAHALPLAEQELALLSTIATRLGIPSAAPGTPVQAAVPVPPPRKATPTPAPVAASSAAPVPPPAPPPPTTPPPATPVRIPAPRPSQTAAPPSPPPDLAAPSPGVGAPAAPQAAPPRSTPRFDPPTAEELRMALDRGTTTVIMRALYAEVMGCAETVWASGAIPSLRVWQPVCESTWYRESFVPLGLRPVSDFYAIIEDIIKSLGASPPKEKVAELLNRRGFAQTLLALREVFQRHIK